ncbi:(R)-mandelonitrile lyase [Andreprevotia chitinilytica]|uniref:(R)-mandelonitrile lyase n=1 Tax=Andreprevotia chitinilytica TaxID=396808 RepID=UPI0005538565|nr:carboxymuconolactone decarboxylase family protein [Andreprevotia chitinilytica]
MKALLCLALSGAAIAASAQAPGAAATVPVVAVHSVAELPATSGPAETFTGSVRISSPFQALAPGRAGGATVSFEAGARTAWHTHPLGQILIVTSGLGLVQQEGQPARVIRPGDVVTIPAHIRHWHGAGPGGSMTHIAIAEKEDGSAVTWQDKVSDKDYQAALASAGVTPASADVTPSRAQQLMGDVAPKLAELTDQVLFGDVWERPGLSKRDRSLATVSALIAMNRPDQLRSHIALALQNGLTRQELSELITHLAFYAGWPSAATGATAAKEVFSTK